MCLAAVLLFGLWYVSHLVVALEGFGNSDSNGEATVDVPQLPAGDNQTVIPGHPVLVQPQPELVTSAFTDLNEAFLAPFASPTSPGQLVATTELSAEMPGQSTATTGLPDAVTHGPPVLWATPLQDEVLKELRLQDIGILDAARLFPSLVVTHFRDVDSDESRHAMRDTFVQKFDKLMQVAFPEVLVIGTQTAQGSQTVDAIAIPVDWPSLMEQLQIPKAVADVLLGPEFLQEFATPSALLQAMGGIVRQMREQWEAWLQQGDGAMASEFPGSIVRAFEYLGKEVKVQSELLVNMLSAFQKYREENPQVPWVQVLDSLEKALAETIQGSQRAA